MFETGQPGVRVGKAPGCAGIVEGLRHFGCGALRAVHFGGASPAVARSRARVRAVGVAWRGSSGQGWRG